MKPRLFYLSSACFSRTGEGSGLEYRVVGNFGFIYTVGMGGTYVLPGEVVGILTVLNAKSPAYESEFLRLFNEEQEERAERERLASALNSLMEIGLICEHCDDVGS